MFEMKSNLPKWLLLNVVLLVAVICMYFSMSPGISETIKVFAKIKIGDHSPIICRHGKKILNPCALIKGMVSPIINLEIRSNVLMPNYANDFTRKTILEMDEYKSRLIMALARRSDVISEYGKVLNIGRCIANVKNCTNKNSYCVVFDEGILSKLADQYIKVAIKLDKFKCRGKEPEEVFKNSNQEGLKDCMFSFPNPLELAYCYVAYGEGCGSMLTYLEAANEFLKENLQSIPNQATGVINVGSNGKVLMLRISQKTIQFMQFRASKSKGSCQI
ncbi:hypothetical protein ACOME3_004170 [Neoechinorhynchus agilis]